VAQRFYFDLRGSRAVIVDETGIRASDLNEAVVQALEALREMRAGGEMDDFDDGWKLVIRDDLGEIRSVFSVW
jgi:hypothetical protein